MKTYHKCVKWAQDCNIKTITILDEDEHLGTCDVLAYHQDCTDQRVVYECEVGYQDEQGNFTTCLMDISLRCLQHLINEVL